MLAVSGVNLEAGQPAVMVKLREAARVVRDWMTSHYGKGVSLAGHCIEASELLVQILHLLDMDAEMVEGWLHYDDTRYCEFEYDPHTWVEVTIDRKMFYVDVTADQFNYGMDPEAQFPPIIVQEGYPHGISRQCGEVKE